MSTPERIQFREVLAVREFRALFAAQTLSVLGDQIAVVAVVLLVFGESGNSPLVAALALAVTYLNWLVGGPILSALADRLPRRDVMVTCDLARAALFGLLALPGIPLPVMFVVLILASVLAPPFNSARAAVLPDVLEGDRYVVGSSLTNVVFQGASVVGFAVGGAIVALTTTRGALALDALTFIASAVVVRLGVGRHVPPAGARAAVGGLLAATGEGIRIVFADPLLRSILLLAWIGAAFSVVPEGLAVAVADGGDDERSLEVGLLIASMPLGVVVGGLLAARLLAPATRVRLMLPMAGLMFVPLLATPLSPSLVVTGLLWGLAGLGSAFQLAANAVFVQAVPPEARGRAFGVAASGLQVSQGLALAVAGAVAEWVDASAVIAGAAAVGLAGVGLLALRWPEQLPVRT